MKLTKEVLIILIMRYSFTLSTFLFAIMPFHALAENSSQPVPFAPLDQKNTVSIEMLKQFTQNPQGLPPEILSILTNSDSLEPPTILKGNPTITQEMTKYSDHAPFNGKINRPLLPTINGFNTQNNILLQEPNQNQNTQKNTFHYAINSLLNQNNLSQQILANQIPSLQDTTQQKSKSMFGTPLQLDSMQFQDLHRLQIMAAQSQDKKTQPINKKEQNNFLEEDKLEVKLPQLSETEKALNQLKIQELEEKAKQDDEQAKIQLAHAYFYGLGGEKNFDRAFQLMEENAKRGSSVAMLELGKMYEEDTPRKNIMRAASYYKQASEYGNINGKYHLGLLYYKGKFGQGEQALTEAIYAFREGLAKDHAPSMYELATMYERGIGFDKDLGQAVQLFRKSAHLGYAPAQLQVGLFYENGILVPQNLTFAAAWYTKSAEQGNALAQYLLAGMYRQGKGVPKNLEQAKILYEHAAKKELLDAQFDLGIFYLLKGPYHDEKKAEFWLQKAADKNDMQAKEILLQIHKKKISNTNTK